MTCVIFGSVPCDNWDFLKAYLGESYAVICADGGVHNARRAGMKIDAVIGDWDSGGAPIEGVPAYPLPPEKDMTDLQSAVALGFELGYDNFLLCGCLGGRMDHTAFNFHLLAWISEQGGRGLILDEGNELRYLSNATVTIPNASNYTYLSVFPLDRQVHGVTLTGVKYPLDNVTLTRGETLSVSNEPVGEESSITIGEGAVLIIRSREKQ